MLLQLARTPKQTPSDLARTLELNRTAVHRSLATLEARGFVRRLSGESVFVLGAAILELAQSVEPDIRAAARPVMDELAAECGETVLLFLAEESPSGPVVTAVEQVHAESHVLRIRFELGHSVPMHVGAAGQAILAFETPEVIAAAMAAADAPAHLAQQLDDVRAQGYAMSHDKLLEGVAGIAAPILGDSRPATASLSIAVPVSRAHLLTGWADRLRVAASKVAVAAGSTLSHPTH